MRPATGLALAVGLLLAAAVTFGWDDDSTTTTLPTGVCAAPCAACAPCPACLPCPPDAGAACVVHERVVPDPAWTRRHMQKICGCRACPLS